MKLTVTVDLEDLFVEGESDSGISVQEEIIQSIKQKIKYEAIDKLGKDYITLVSEQIRLEINTIAPNLATNKVLEVIQNEKIKRVNYSEENITILEYTKNFLETHYNVGSKLDDLLKKEVSSIGEKIVHELKTRYDMLFASQLVAKMNEVGMLKEDIARILLSDK